MRGWNGLLGIAGAGALGLAGCGSATEKDFLCTAQEGTPCATISAIDGTGADGIVTVTERPEDTAVKSLSQEPLYSGKGALAGVPDGGYPYNAALYHSPELVGTLWIAPILDGDGILEEARFVHFVLREGAWKS